MAATDSFWSGKIRHVVWPIVLVAIIIAGRVLRRLQPLAIDPWVSIIDAISLIALIVLMVHVGYRLLIFLLSGRLPVLGVAQSVVREAMRLKLIVAFIVLLILVVASLPFILSADQPLRFQLQQFLSWSLRASMLLLSLLTVFLACGTLANEVDQKQIFTTMTKPIGRGKYLFGKWLGIMSLNVLLLTVTAVAIYLITVFYLAQMPPRDAMDRLAIQEQVLTARVAAAPMLPTNFDEVVAREVEARRNAAENDPTFERAGEVALEEQVRNDALLTWLSLAPRNRGSWQRTFIFDGLGPAREQSQSIQLAYKVQLAEAVPGQQTELGFQVNQMPWDSFPVVVDQVQHLELPTSLITETGRIAITVSNLNQQSSISFPPSEGLRMLYISDSFAGNFVRGQLMNVAKLAFLAALGLMLASFLSLPVAILGGLLTYAAAASSQYILEAVDQTARTDAAIPVIGTLLDLLAWAFTYPLQAFSRFNPADPLTNGRYIPWTDVGICAGWIGVGWTVVIGLLGWLIFTRRELARVQV